MGLVDTIAMSVTACCLNNISSVVTFHTKGSTKRSWDHKKTLCLRLPSRGSKKAFTTYSNTLVDMRDRGLPRNSLYSSTRCLSFHVEWQVELRKDKEGLDTVGILLAEHHAHQSAWHHVEAQLSVLYVFWNKGVTCNFFLLQAHQHASAGFGRQRAFMQKLLLPWLLHDALPRSAPGFGRTWWPECTGAWAKATADDKVVC